MNQVTKMLEVKKRLRKYREEEQRSFPWIAEKCGISRSTLNKFANEDGRTMMPENLDKLELFLKERGY